MQSILDAINEWIKEILIGAINGNLSTMFGDVNEKVGTIAAEVGQTPQGWNAGIFSMIQSLSENVIVPIAGLVITYVLCVELISMVSKEPVATIAGVPMYADIFGTIPIAEALLAKGAQLGVVLSFMMGVTTLSLPEMIMLRKAVKPKLLGVFIAICTVGIIIVGYFFNAIQYLIV